MHVAAHLTCIKLVDPALYLHFPRYSCTLADAAGALIAAGVSPDSISATPRNDCTSKEQNERLAEWCAVNCAVGFCPENACVCGSSASHDKQEPSTSTLAPTKQSDHTKSAEPNVTASFGATELSSCKTLTQTGRTITPHDLLVGGWDMAKSQPFLLVNVMACHLEMAKAATKQPEVASKPRSRAERRIASDNELLACPLNTPNATEPKHHAHHHKYQAAEVLALHRTMLEAGFMRLDGTNKSYKVDPPVSELTRGAGTFESRLWPRPAVCASHPGARLDLKEFIHRDQLTKLVNEKRGFEYRPVLKAGSTMMRHLLPCLQPNEWKEVPQRTPVDHGTTLLVLQRDPISRFASLGWFSDGLEWSCGSRGLPLDSLGAV